MPVLPRGSRGCPAARPIDWRWCQPMTKETPQMPMNEHDRRIERAGRRVNELRAWRNAREFPITDWTLTPSDWHDHPPKRGDSWPVIEIPVKLKRTGLIP